MSFPLPALRCYRHGAKFNIRARPCPALFAERPRRPRSLRQADGIERQPNGHLAFGGYGTHFCLGASLARLELKVMFEELLKSLPDIELDTDRPRPRRPSNFVVGIETMAVRFAAR